MNKFLPFGLGLVLCSSAVFAQMTPPPSPADSTAVPAEIPVADFSSLDTDADGKLSKAEVATNSEIKKSFKTLDVNKDGKLSQSEYVAFESNAARQKDTKLN